MARKKLSSRAARRERSREGEKLARARERLAQLQPGGAPDRPVEVASASQIEPHAAVLECLRCEGKNRLDEHAAETVAGARLRVVRMTCSRCATRRAVWFKISPVLSN